MYLYLSNDNLALGGAQVEVYFDDFKVEHVKSPVISTDDYYSGGATYNSFVREDGVSNKVLFQETELQDELGLNLYDFDARLYDPFTWRTTTLDGHAEMYANISPYAFLNNSPINFLDPTGLDVITWNGGTDAICPTCPNTPQFQPLIDDPDNVYHYDDVTGTASLVPMLNEVVVQADRSEGVDALDLAIPAAIGRGVGTRVLTVLAAAALPVTLTVALVSIPLSTNDGEMEQLKKMQVNSKGGKQNLWDDELSPLSDAELEAEFIKAKAARDTKRLQKLVKEEKRRGQRNKQKR